MYYIIEVDYVRLFDDKPCNAYYANDRASGGCPYFSSTPIESQVRTFTTPEDAIKNYSKELLEDDIQENFVGTVFIRDIKLDLSDKLITNLTLEDWHKNI